MFTVEQAAALYGVPLIDYGAERGRGVLVSSGAGLMMSVMDACPELRWAVDYDGLSRSARIADFLLMAERAASLVAVCGWFSYTDPRELREAIGALVSRPPVVYGGNVRLTTRAYEPTTLEAFLWELHEAAAWA